MNLVVEWHRGAFDLSGGPRIAPAAISTECIRKRIVVGYHPRMAFGDRRKYRLVATTYDSLLPHFFPSILAYPNHSAIRGAPPIAVTLQISSQAKQLLWLEEGAWRSMVIVTSPESGVIRDNQGPARSDPPIRWALGIALRYYDRWLADDSPGEVLRAAQDQVSLPRLFIEDMSRQIRALLLT